MIEERKSINMNTNIMQNLILENRGKLSVSGVNDVLSFDDQVVMVDTELGLLTVKGEKLHIGSFSTTSGDIDIDGKVIALVYTDEESNKGGFFRRLMK